MKLKHLTILTGLLASLAGSRVSAQTLILADDYNVPANGTGFELGSGVNSGINPPTTRMTGLVAEGLRYIKAYGQKPDDQHRINNQRFHINRYANESSTITLSAGSTPFDFSSALNTLAASPSLPSVYEVRVKMSLNAANNQRCSLAISSTAGTAGAWDFAVQLYRVNSSATTYTIQKRVSTGASGLGSNVNIPIGTYGTYSEQVPFLIRITDAGAGNPSRVQVSLNEGETWFYDSESDGDLPNGWRFPNASRFIFFDSAPGGGAATWDDLSITWISGPTVENLVWTGEGSDDFWSTAANWNGQVPATGDTVTFEGSNRQANYNDISDLIVQSITFNNGGFNISGVPLGVSDSITSLDGVNTFTVDLNWDSTVTKSWNVAENSEVLLANNTSIEVNGNHELNGGGTLKVTGNMSIGVTTPSAIPAFIVNEGRHVIDGGTFTSRGGYRIGSSDVAALGAETILTNGANFTLLVSGGNLRVGDSANPVASRLIVDNSTLTMSGGELGIPYNASATGEVLQNGGLVSGAVVNMRARGTYVLKDGILEPRQIKKTGSGTATIQFDNATLRPASGFVEPFFSGVNVAEILAGGLILDAYTDFTVDQALRGAGGLRKTGFSKLTLAGANTYTGNTVVESGALVVPTVRTNTSSAIQVADGAEFGVVLTEHGSSAGIGSLTFAGNSFGTFSFDLGAFSTPTAPLARVGTLTANGPVVINVHNGNMLSVGQIVLVDYDNIVGAANFTLGSLPAGVSGNLVVDTVNGSIELNITAVPGLRWTGAVDGTWDHFTPNWLDLQTSAATAFVDYNPTEFLDGAATGEININTFPMPSAIIVSNSALPYTWSGEYFIITPVVKKDGDGTLTRVGGETDEIGAFELNEGTFVLDHFYDIPSYPTVFSDNGSGLGTFVKDGASRLTLTADNSAYNGDIVVRNGVLKMGVAGSIGSTNGTIIIEDGATLDLNNIVAPNKPVVVSGEGYLGQGAITDTDSATGVAHNLTDVTMVGHTTFGAIGRWDLRVRTATGPGPGLRGNGYDLTKVGPGFVSIACQRHFNEANQPYWQMNLGDIYVKEGTLTFAESVSLGNPEKSITIFPGTSFNTYNLWETNPIVRTIYITDARISGDGPATGTNVYTGTINASGNIHLRATDAKLVINGPIVGSASVGISATDAGAVFLNGVNTYTGNTIVTNGVFGGSGSLAGNLTIQSGATTSPGMNGVGILTVGGNATLAGTTVMELDRSKSPNSDRISVNGTLQFGGTLNVVIAPGAPAPQAGDVYQLFNKAGSGTFAAVNLPDLSGLPGNLSWDTSNLYVNGTIAVAGTAAPPVFGSISIVGGNLQFEGTGGVEGATYVILASPDVAAPIANWIPVATNTFGAGGSFNYNHSIESDDPTMFFMLQLP